MDDDDARSRAGGSESGALRIGATADAEALDTFAAVARDEGLKLVVGALVADLAGRIYVQRRSEGRALFPGCWDIVGGHVEEGEGLLAALAREIAEETGWRLVDVGPVVEVLDWSAGDGVRRREVDLLARVAGDLEAPYLEPGKHSEGRWLTPAEVDVLLERREPADRWVHEVVARAFEVLPDW